MQLSNILKTLIVIAFCFSLVGTAMAETAAEDQISFTIKQSTPATLEVPVFENDITQCITCTCTISINYQNGTNLIRNVATAMNSNYAIYDLSSAQNAILGKYNGEVHCTNGVDNGGATFKYLVTPTGDDRGISWILILIIGGVAIWIIAMVIHNSYIGFAGGGIMIYAGVYCMIYGFNNVTDIYTRAIAFVMIGLGAVIAILAGFEIIAGGNEGDE